MKKTILKLSGVALIITISLINSVSKTDVGLISEIGLSQIQMMAVASTSESGGGVITCHSVTSCRDNYTTDTDASGNDTCCGKNTPGLKGHKQG